MNEIEDTSKKLEKPGMTQFYIVHNQAWYELQGVNGEKIDIHQVIKNNLLWQGKAHNSLAYACWWSIGCDLKDFFPVSMPQSVRFKILKRVTEKRVGNDYFTILFVDS